METDPKILWDILGDCPINEEDEIDQDLDFGIIKFQEGTDRFEIWQWFEEYFNLSIIKDLMFKSNKI